MKISPFNPIFFLHGRKTCGIESPFTQFFSVNDTVSLQVIRALSESALSCKLHSEDGTQATVTPSTHTFDSVKVDIYTLSNLNPGCYYITIGEEESEWFEVTADESKLADSVLIEYSIADNTTRHDVAGIINDTRFYFSFRIPGGFKDSGFDFSVESEQFTTQEADIVQLYALESTQETLTVGLSEGVPIWVGQLLNRLLTCRYVYIDGQRYARYQTSVPEKEQPVNGINSFIFTQKLQKIQYLEPIKS